MKRNGGPGWKEVAVKRWCQAFEQKLGAAWPKVVEEWRGVSDGNRLKRWDPQHMAAE